jgi:anti-sigma factor RsiW
MSEAPTTRTIRLYCDGELPDEQARQVEEQLRQDPRLRAQVEFERQLKQRVGQVMQSDRTPVPAELPGRIRQTPAAAGDSSAVVGRIDAEPQPAPAGSAWWRGPNRANVFAVAACLALVAGAVLFGILGQPIDSMRVSGAADATMEAAAAVAGEHVVMTTSGLEAAAEKARFRTPDEARRGLASQLGAASDIFDLRELGYEFVAGDHCAVPHCEQGCHLVYRRVRGAPGIVSLHIVPDQGQFALDDRFPRSLPCITDVIPEGPECHMDVLVWSYGGFSYLLVVCVDDDVRAVAARMQDTLLSSGTAPGG